MNDLEKVLLGREIITAYKRTIAVKGYKNPIDIKKYTGELNNLDLTVKSFYELNLKMNLTEIDRCFRVRDKNDSTKSTLCDSCVGRLSKPCIEELCGDVDSMAIFDYLVPDSKIIAEQKEFANSIDVIPLFYLRPFSYYHAIKHKDEIEQYCNVSIHQIEEPIFDILWGMETHLKFGEMFFQAIMKNKLY